MKKVPKARKSFDEECIPSDRVAPGAPNPPPGMYFEGGIAKPRTKEIMNRKKKGAKFNHGQY